MIDNKCRSCKYSKDWYGDACYCMKYGIMITYGKMSCKGHALYHMRNRNYEGGLANDGDGSD